MKKCISFILVLLILGCLCACAPSGDKEIDIDLTLMSSTMAYSAVSAMYKTPDDYIGKTVKARGQFSAYYSEAYARYYFSVLYIDSTACCSLPVEFILDDANYPDGYPQSGTVITVQGVFDTYQEGENIYFQLNSAKVIQPEEEVA